MNLFLKQNELICMNFLKLKIQCKNYFIYRNQKCLLVRPTADCTARNKLAMTDLFDFTSK